MAILDKLNIFSLKIKSFFSWIGNNTYSIYLWHLPMQVTILFIFDYFNLDRSFFNNGYVFIGWIILMVLISRLSFLYIEKPLKILIKNKLLG